ncbi:hypothetical protein Axy16_054 [Achromobacter phage vB_AxyS_19-32_Axy16]|nr:hypothetical protein Axy16_054 [Achromobacter phage vB_AxyS_19-32_Axy16]
MNKHSKVGKDSRTCRRLDELCDKNAKRKGAVWTTCEQHDMRRAWERGLSVGSIGLIHGRTAGAIASRLRQMHLIDDKIYMNFGIFPDFTIEMCGAQHKIEPLIRMGLLCSTGRSELVAEVPRERRWPQAEAYMGYVPGATVGLSKDITPLEFYYPQALAKSAIGPMIREGRLYHYGGMPTWDLTDVAKKFAGQDSDMNLREAQRVAESAVITGIGVGCLNGDWVVPSEFVVDKLKGVELDTLAMPGIYYQPPSDKAKWSITANCLPSPGRSVVTDMTIQVQDLEAALRDKAFVESPAFVRALKNAGFQLQALDVQSSQCVDKHADTQTKQEQDMQEKIQNAINLLETDVIYPMCRFMYDGQPTGKQYTYKHRGELEKGDVVIVVTPGGYPALALVEDFATVLDLKPNIHYKWIAQVFDSSEYDMLTAREKDARNNLRTSILEKTRKEKLNELLGDLGESDEVKTARSLLSSKSHAEIIREQLDAAAKRAEEQLKELEKTNPEMAEAVRGLQKSLEQAMDTLGDVPGIPGIPGMEA